MTPTQAVEPLPAWAWALAAIFVMSAAWAITANLILFSRLLAAKRITFSLGALAVLIYLQQRALLKTRVLDFLGFSTLIAALLSIVSCVALQPVL